MKDGSAVYCESLQFAYQDGPLVLRNINLEVDQGEFVIIAGPSGEGKSTLCRTFNNIVPKFYRGTLSGKRRIAGDWLEKQNIASMAKKVGIVFQDFEQQLFSTSALLELCFGLENFGVPPEEIRERLQALLEKFQLGHLTGREPASLSGGEKQKLAIASVLAYRPGIVVLDEPTTDLDPDSREFVMQILPALKEWTDTLIVVEHETEWFHSAHRIFLMRDGIIQKNGRPEEILTASTLLVENSLPALDLVRMQELLGRSPELQTPAGLRASLKDYKLEPHEITSRTQAPTVLEVQHLSFHYGDQNQDALQDVSFEIRKGEFVGIIGRNGSGKSTLLRHLNGLQLPQKGTLRILGKDVREWNRKQLARAVGLVFQNPDHQIFNSTVRTEVEFGPRQFDISGEEIARNVDRALETMDLVQQAERDPFQLSKGERQRVAVASVLSVSPEILILDEPTTGLDYKQQTYLMNLLREWNRTGTTIIIVTHALKLVGDYCNYAILMQNGKVASEGHPRELFFGKNFSMKQPPLWEIVHALGGNSLTVEEVVDHLKQV